MAMLNKQRVTWILRPAMGMISHKLTMISRLRDPRIFVLAPGMGDLIRKFAPFQAMFKTHSTNIHQPVVKYPGKL